MMKQTLVVLALIGLGCSAPQPKKIFHEHFEDFLDVIFENAGEEINELMEQYLEFEQFSASLQYMQTNSFKNLVLEMESLPEFIAVVDFLERDNIDIHFFIDMINEALDIVRMKRSARQQLSGTDLSSFINDCIAVFPKDKLSALYDEKMANDAEFSDTMNNLQSDEWFQVFSALIDSDAFQKEAAIFMENGIDLHSVFEEIVAIFGQN